MGGRPRLLACVVSVWAVACSSDGASSPSPTLHADCSTESECADGETCAEREHPEGAVSTCEITCDSSDQCPSGHWCNTPPCPPDDVTCGLCASDAADDRCAACLAAGGTWQPEAEECTEDCALQDISCFRDDCPGACEEDCGNCFSRDDCEAAGCTWRQADEAAWCT